MGSGAHALRAAEEERRQGLIPTSAAEKLQRFRTAIRSAVQSTEVGVIGAHAQPLAGAVPRHVHVTIHPRRVEGRHVLERVPRAAIHNAVRSMVIGAVGAVGAVVQ